MNSGAADGINDGAGETAEVTPPAPTPTSAPPKPRIGVALGRFDRSLAAIKELVVAIAPKIDELDTTHRRIRDLLGALRPDQIDRLNALVRGFRDEVSRGAAFGERHVTFEINLEDDHFGELTDQVMELFPTLVAGPSLMPPAKGELLHGALLTIAVSTFEMLVAAIFTEHYKAHPDALDPSERKFSLAELRGFPTIADAEAAAIADRVDQHMHGGLDEWARWFSRSLECNVEDLSDNWSAIEEVFQRRHLIVHSEGRVTAQYLAKVRGSTARPGRRLVVGQRYLLRAVDRLSLLGHMLAFEVQLKWLPKDSATIAGRMQDRCYRALLNHDWPLAERIGTRGLRAKAKQDTREAMRCNAWLAMKRLGRLESVKAEIMAWDTSAMEPQFKLARHCLLDDLDEAFALLPGFLAFDSDHRDALARWPILEELRLDPRCAQYLRKRGRRPGTKPITVVKLTLGAEGLKPALPPANGPAPE